jgi:DNA-binding response OmpR family regulator
MARILIVDDDVILRELVMAWLLLAGHDCLEATDGLDALALMRADPEAPVDLVLCDFMMPRVDGPALVAAIRADPHLAHIPVIVLTVRSRPEDAAQLLDAGADDYVRKPIDWAELRARLDRQLRQAARRAAA